MNYWMHFVGKGYYSPSKFVKEMQSMGFCRRVAMKQAKRFNFGDIIFFLTNKKGESGGRCFSAGVITGFRTDADLSSVSGATPMDTRGVMGGRSEDRGCGSLALGKSFSVHPGTTLGDISKHSEEKGATKMFLVGEQVFLFDLLGVHDFVFRDVKFRQGFRTVDFEGIKKALHDFYFEGKDNTGRTPRITGHFYPDGDGVGTPDKIDAVIQNIVGYHLDEPKKRGKKK